MFIDIHNHMLYGVDDGPKKIEESVAVLLEAKQQGAEEIIVTPHYRRGIFPYQLKDVEKHFLQLEEKAQKLGIRLHLGCEYHVDGELIENLKSGRCKTMAEGDYVLTEYSYQTDYSYIEEQTGRLLSCGFFPVIAHVERYRCLQKKPVLCAELSNMGAMIQINADSVLGLTGWSAKRFCRKLLKQEWADVIASDTHDSSRRACHMKACKEYVEKKYGADYAKTLFIKNPRRIIHNI